MSNSGDEHSDLIDSDMTNVNEPQDSNVNELQNSNFNESQDSNVSNLEPISNRTESNIDQDVQKFEVGKLTNSQDSNNQINENPIDQKSFNKFEMTCDQNKLSETLTAQVDSLNPNYANVHNESDDLQSIHDNRITISHTEYLKSKNRQINRSNNAVYDQIADTHSMTDNQFRDHFKDQASDQLSDSSSVQQSNDDTCGQFDQFDEQKNLISKANSSACQFDGATDNNTQDNEPVDKLKNELNRLKQHLIQIEEDYTNELVEVQQREERLEKQLIEARTEIEQLNRRLNNTGPLVAIRQQAKQALDERDQAFERCNKLEDEVQRGQASLANLQLVIERMQKDHDQRLQTANKLYEQNIREERCRYAQLENEINKYQLKLKESNNALQAAARLSAQLHSKQETIDQLKIHLQKKEELVNRLHDEINNLNASSSGKVDKQFVKNLVVGYFNAASDKKQDVARLLARILDFNELEMKKAGIQLGTSSAHHDSFGHRRQSSTSSTASYTTQDESIAQQFVHFLEEESKVHKAPIAKQLAHDLTKVVSQPDQIRATNLINKPSFVTNNTTPQSNNSSLESSNLGQLQTPPEVRPRLFPISVIMNAKLSRLSFNTNGAHSTSQTTSQPANNPLNPSSSNDNIKPVVLNFPSNTDSKNEI